MECKIVLAAALCLAAVLSMGAAPALAADGCDCHTAVPPTAAPAHTPFVTSVSDCTVCHIDWVVPHPEDPVRPLFGLGLSGDATETGYDLKVWVGLWGVWAQKSVPHPDVAVYLQQRLWGASGFTDLGQVTTDSTGGATFTVDSPLPFTAYRAVSQGHVGPLRDGGTGLFRPRVSVLLPTPTVTLKLVYLKHGTVRLGKTVRARGTVTPVDAGSRIAVLVQKRAHNRWTTRVRYCGDPRIGATGNYSWKFTPRTRGLWRVQASTDQHSDTMRWGSSPWRKVRVR